jgi:hypothetical protein
MTERTGPGRPPLPEEERTRPYSVSMRPQLIDALRGMSKTQGRSMGAVLDHALGLEDKDQTAKVRLGREAFAAFLKAEFGHFDGHNHDGEHTTIFEAVDGKQFFAQLTDRALYTIGAHGRTAGDYLKARNAHIVAAMRRELYVAVDAGDGMLLQVVDRRPCHICRQMHEFIATHLDFRCPQCGSPTHRGIYDGESFEFCDIHPEHMTPTGGSR